MRISVLTSLGTTLDAFFPELVESWEGMGHRVFTASKNPSNVGEHTQVESLSRRPSLHNVFAHRDISKWLERTAADVLITNTATASALARTRKIKIPVIYFCHGLHWNSGVMFSDKAWQMLESMFVRNTDAVITINTDDEQWFARRISSDRLLRLQAGVGVPLSKYHESPLAEAGDFSLLWAGEFTDRKRPFLAVDVFSEIKRQHPHVSMTMIGDGPLRSAVQTDILSKGLGNAITLPGRMPFSEVLPKHQILLHTAEWEGLPRVGLEAAAMGRKTFAFDVKGVRDLPAVVLAMDGDVAGLAGSIIGAMSEPATTLTVDAGIRQTLDSSVTAERIASFAESVSASSALHSSE